MTHSDRHLSDKVLVRLADGELSAREANEGRAHLAACWDCRTRFVDLESAIGAFVHAYHAGLDPQLPPADGPRALLRACLQECGPISPGRRWLAITRSTVTATPWRYAFAALLLGLAALMGSRYHRRQQRYSVAALTAGVFPDRALTPGVVRSVEQKDVCSADDNDPAWLIPASVQQDVLREYGITGSRARDYQLDYLIPPSLGGTSDLQNVWPEPYSNSGWNGHVKDELENRLRQLVCEGRVSLSQAQRDISGDWTQAYNKYFHISRPGSAL
ncbi:MAG TPA: hypothetical protein VMT20_08240 [Terriglobia bacterium]|nr:hypothetical protein [Terriglobia bacterium]